MLHELKRLISECLESRLGRALFLIHLLVSMTLVGYVWNHSQEQTMLVHECRRLFYLLNWVSINRLDGIYAIFGTPPASRFRDGATALLFSIPWWLYGYGAEVAAAKVRAILSLDPFGDPAPSQRP